MQTVIKQSIPLEGVRSGYRFEASRAGYDIYDAVTGAVVKIERGATTAAAATNAQRAMQWIANQLEPRDTLRRGWFD